MIECKRHDLIGTGKSCWKCEYEKHTELVKTQWDRIETKLDRVLEKVGNR